MSEPLEQVRRAVYRPVRRSNALEDTVSRIVQTIRVGVVAPGEALPAERALASMLGVSRDTVREAIRELADTGIVVPRRGRYGGTFVADPIPPADAPPGASARTIDDVLGMRRVLEGGAARAAAGSSGSFARETLPRMLEQTRAADLGDYRRSDSLLHLAVAEAAGIPSLLPLIAENRAQVNAWLDAFPLLPRAIAHSEEQHSRIVSAIVDRRPDTAEAAMLEHVAASEALIRGFVG